MAEPIYGNTFQEDFAARRRMLPQAVGASASLTDEVGGLPAARARQRRLEEQLAAIESQEPDLSAMQDFARQQGEMGQGALLNALAAQYAGEGFQPLQTKFLRRAEAAQQPLRVGTTMITPTGEIMRDPFAERERNIGNLGRRVDRAAGDVRLLEAVQERARTEALRQRERLDAQEDIVRLTANLRPSPQPQAPVAVIGPDGQPVYVSPASAVGQRPASGGGSNKPLPASVQKMVQENVEIIGTAGGINADLSGIAQQISEGTLRFNPLSNTVARVRNATGFGNEQTANFASFRSNMERLRNESLRLNKGVQTDGDAQRAWNELFDNINDQGVVSQRLAEIQKINERAMALRGMDVERIYNEYGRQAPDLSRYSNLTGATNLPRPGQITGQGQGAGPQPGQSVQITAPGRGPALPPMDAIDAEIRRRQGQR
jgi:hypothetical protein